jgi:aspartyl-tRNA synthetase
VQGVELDATFPRMTWAEAMRRFGSDKPDLRIALELVDIADAVKHVEFKVFAEPANDASRSRRGAARPGGSTLSRKEIDGLTEYVSRYGAKGLAWLRIDDLAKGREGINSPVAKFLDDAALDGMCSRRPARRAATCCSSVPAAGRPSPTSWVRCA